MRLCLLFFLILSFHLTESKRQKPSAKTKAPKEDEKQRHCGDTGNHTRPLSISSDFCCDSQLEALLRAAPTGGANERLGDRARILQKTIQRSLGHSFEVIMGRKDFSLTSHYHGQKVCKVLVGGRKRKQAEGAADGGLRILAYQTPYNVDDLPEESRMAAIDAQETLGSTPEDDRGHFPDIRIDPLAGEDPSLQPSPRVARAAVYSHKYGNNTSHRQGKDLNEGESRLPDGLQCSRGRGGSACCSGAMFDVMENALHSLSTSPEFDDNEKTPGVVANLIKRKMQQLFGRVFEVVVSNSDFEQATHQVGDYRCKFQSHGLHLMAYETPHQSAYNPYDLSEEAHFSSISDPDPLGTSQLYLPNQRDISKALELETEGERTGFPKGSHCEGGERLGSACCSLPLFKGMHSVIQRLQQDDTLGQLDKRDIAAQLQTAAERATNRPMEVVVSTDDFVVSSHKTGDNSCKFRVENYFVMAWETPAGGYVLGEEHYADNGFTSMVGCGSTETIFQGAACCSGELRYTMVRAIEETTNYEHTKADVDAVARATARAAQARFNRKIDTIVSRGDFVWGRPDTSFGFATPLTCKVDLYAYHILTFQSGPGFPLPNEFAIPGELGSVQCADCGVPAFIQSVVPQPAVQSVIPQPPVQQVIPPQVFQPLVVQQIAIPQAVPQFAIPQAVPQFAIPQAVPQFVQQVAVAPIVPVAGGFCFSEDTWVTTPTGKKNMAMLELGDYVLTANLTHKYFAPVTVWMHRDPEKYAHFYTIMTEYGKMLRITAKHLIFRNKCDEWYKEFIKELPKNEEAVFAHELAVGDCVILLYSGKWRQQKIKEITRTKRKGIYAPLTSNGRILVNDILASCYSDVKGSTIQTTYFQAISLMREAYYDLTGWLKDKKIELPFSTDILKEVLSIILPN